MRRALVVAALFVLSAILYVDRACIASAKGPIAHDLGLTDGQMGLVFGVFALGYALAQVPSGWLIDRFGARVVLFAVVAAWSALTALTGTVRGFGTLLAVRFLFGVFEAGAFPGAARVFYAWLTPGQRGFANGLLFSGSRLGAALAFPLLPWMLGQWGWRASFGLLGIVGVVWGTGWLIWFRDQGGEAPADEDAPVVTAAPVRYGAIFRMRELRLALVQYFCGNFTFFIGLTWMLPYLQERFHLSAAAAARYAMVPFVVAATSQWISGFAVDALYRSRWQGWSRRIPAIAGFGIAAVGLAAVSGAATPATVVGCFAVAIFGTDMTLSPSWSYCIDLGGKGSGTVSGAMNMVGNIGAFVSAMAFPRLLALTGSPALYFYLAAILCLGGAACWLGMRPTAERSRS